MEEEASSKIKIQSKRNTEPRKYFGISSLAIHKSRLICNLKFPLSLNWESVCFYITTIVWKFHLFLVLFQRECLTGLAIPIQSIYLILRMVVVIIWRTVRERQSKQLANIHTKKIYTKQEQKSLFIIFFHYKYSNTLLLMLFLYVYTYIHFAAKWARLKKLRALSMV